MTDGNVHAQDLGGIDQTLGVLLQTEYGRALVATIIGANALEHGVAVVKGVGEHMNLGVLPGNHFTVKPDEFCRFHNKDILERNFL